MLLFFTSLALAQDAPADAEENAPPPEGSLMLANARLIDGTGAPARDASLLILDGAIADVGADLDPGLAAEVLDLEGAFVAPGIIDSHVHITLAPGQFLYDWDQATLDEHLKHHLRAYVAAGVTTVLDCAAVDEDLDRVQGWLDDGHPGPRVLALREPASVPGGYVSTVLPRLPVQETPEDLLAHLDHLFNPDRLLIFDSLLIPDSLLILDH